MTTSTKPSIIHQESKGVEDDTLSDDDGEFSYDSNSDSALSEDDLSIEDDNEREVQEDVTLQDDVGKGMKELTITIETDKDDTKSLQVTTSNDDDVDPQSEQDRVSLSETNLNNSDKREIPRTISDSNQVSSLLGEANEDNSGEAFARLSWSEKLVKKWRRIFWYRGNDGVLYIFNSKHDFDTRVHEQSIVEKKTRKRIKFRQLNFINDVYWDQSIECFTLTETKKKKYAKKGYSMYVLSNKSIYRF
jgi:hypothetical protein